MTRLRLAAFGLGTFALGGASPALAHAFGQRYDLPVPFVMYLAGAGAAVALSFAVMALFMRGGGADGGYPRFNLLDLAGGRALAHPATVFIVRLLSVALFVLIIVAGLIGEQNPFKNIAPTLVWVVWWIGMAYVCALVGNFWAVTNPWNAVAAWVGLTGGLGLRYPSWLGVWPSVAMLAGVAWIELVWDGGEMPANIAWMALAYSVFTGAGMAVFGRHAWLARAEVFSVVFALLARFAPLEVRVSNRDVCAACHAAECADDDCVNCADCFVRASPDDRELNLRPHAVGLLGRRPLHPSMMVFVLLILSTVTYDGFTETPAWSAIVNGLATAPSSRDVLLRSQNLGLDALAVIETGALLLAPVLFLAAFALFSRLMALGGGRSQAVGEIARLFVLSLVPIAIAYHLAHYYSYLLLAGQLAIPLASDPFGFGWNLFGTAGYRLRLEIVDAKSVWIVSVVAIVAGHIVAVYLAHVVAARTFATTRLALRSQVPMLVLMVLYTMISLWILAQPVVEDPTLG